MSSNPTESFKTHSNYLRAFSHLVFEPTIMRRRNMNEVLANRIRASGVVDVPRRRVIDRDQVRSSIHTAWGTETLLQTTDRFANEDEILRLSNNWSTVQTYYILYHCTQALHGAKGHPRPESHPSTQNVFVDQWACRPIILAPWSLAFGYKGAINIPDGTPVDTKVHPWSNCDGINAWSVAVKALMTTRRETLADSITRRRESKKRDRKQAWREKERVRLARGRRPREQPQFPLPRLTREEQAAADRDKRAFTVMDYLYRLRIRTNYEDSNMFTDGPEEESDSRSVRNALCRIANGTLLLYELVIRSIVGADVFDQWVTDWTTHNLPERHDGGIIGRIPFHNG